MVDLQEAARILCAAGGMTPEQAPGLAVVLATLIEDARAEGRRQANATFRAKLESAEARIAQLERTTEPPGDYPDFDIENRDGWALYECCEGEAAGFVAFFADEETATKHAEMRDPDDGESALHIDTCVVPAVLDGNCIVAAGTYDITTHVQLRARIAELRAKEQG